MVTWWCTFVFPGAVVTCRRFLRKLSRKGNVYCSFEACSSLTVQAVAEKGLSVNHSVNQSINQSIIQSIIQSINHFFLFPPDTTPSTADLPQAHQTIQMCSVPRRFLVDLVTSETSGRRIQTISRIRCRVTSVQKLSMRWDCSRCSHVIVREECPQGCRSDVPFRFCAEAR